MKFELKEYKKQLTDEEILSDIKETARKLETDYISISIYKKNGKYSQTAIQAHFGTWRNALAIAGLRTERISSERKIISDEEYCEDLNRVAKLLHKETVTYNEYEKYGKYAITHVFKRLGKWRDALEKAGLKPTGFVKDKITEQECFEEIERLWRMLGRQPTLTDITKKKISRYSKDPFVKRFGSWRSALQAFVSYINETDNEYESAENYNVEKVDAVKTMKEEPVEYSRKKEHRTPRNINTRLRFKVLTRDNYKCCACGASPAKDPSVELQVDHIIPWSKGGETIIDNLQTLCSKCNLGKSNIL